MREDPIVVVDYDEDWPRSFERARRIVEPALERALVRPIEHIGSTAVPGLAAKPIIDMLAVVSSIDDVDDIRFDGTGWTVAPEPGDLEERRRSFCAPSIRRRTHHLHVVEAAFAPRHDWITFRDALRAQPDLVTEYAILKRSLAAAHGHDPNDRDAYRDGKTAFVADVLAAARATSPASFRQAKGSPGTPRVVKANGAP